MTSRGAGMPDREIGGVDGTAALKRAAGGNIVDFDERRLADASIAGNHRAFEHLYTHYYPKVRGFCLRKTSDPQLAEDITQEAFARAFERISDFGGPKHFGGWVGTIASNLITDHYRRKRNDDVPLDTDEERGNAPVYEMNPVRGLQESDTARLVRGALEKLDERQRAAILMHEIRGLTCAAVGDHLGISEVAAESLLARARRRLRRELAKQMTARAAPAAIFNLGGIGLLPVALRGWRRVKAGAVEKANTVQMAASRTFEQVGQAVPTTTAAKGLVVAMGAALAVEAAGAVAPPSEQVSDPQVAPAAAATPEPVPADGDTSSGVLVPEGEAADGVDVSDGAVGVDVGEDGAGAEGSVDVPGADEEDPAGGLDFDVEVGRDEEGNPSGDGHVTVRDQDGNTIVDSGDVGVGGE